MEKMTIHQEVTIDAPVGRVWPFVGTSAGLSAWWGAMVTVEDWVGGRYEERGAHGTFSYHLVGQVIAYEPPRLFAYTLRERMSTGDEWPVDTTVSIILTESAGQTTVILVHSGFEKLPVEYRERKLNGFTRGWTRELARLPAVVAQAVMACV
jgi:uncharacterized protein YndB with AHSA1/START domain